MHGLFLALKPKPIIKESTKVCTLTIIVQLEMMKVFNNWVVHNFEKIIMYVHGENMWRQKEEE